MGSSNFGTIQIGKFKDAQEAYREAVNLAVSYYGTNPYNGTISTTSGCIISHNHPKFGTNSFKEWEDKKLDDLSKWGNCIAVEITGKILKELKKKKGLVGKKGIKAYYFFGWASE